MKTIHTSLPKIAFLAGVIAIATTFNTLPVQALDNPVNPNAPSPNAGVAPGHRAAGNFASKRPGNLPAYRGRTHAYTGVTSKTP